jgi:hypothetical protein
VAMALAAQHLARRLRPGKSSEPVQAIPVSREMSNQS